MLDLVIISTHILIQPNSSIKYNSSPASSGPNSIPDHSHHDGQSQILTSGLCGVPVFSGGWRRGGARVVPVTEVGYNILSTFKSVIVARTQDPWISCGRSWQVPRRGIVTVSLNKQTATNIVPGGAEETHIFSFSIGGGEQAARSSKTSTTDS